MANRFLHLSLGISCLCIAAYADTAGPFFCSDFPNAFQDGAGGPAPVTCPGFTVPGGTLTGVSLVYVADYQFGVAFNTVEVRFTPVGPAGVTWNPPTQVVPVSGGRSSPIPIAMGGADATGGISAAAFAAPFNVNVSSVVTAGLVATSSGGVIVTYTYTPPPPVTLVCPANIGTVGVPYSSALIAGGGVPPFTYSIAVGSLPPPLILNPSTGAIMGIPAVGGPFAFTAKVVDSTGTAAGTKTTDCTITVIVPPPVALTCPATMGVVGVPYSSALVGSGGVPPYTFSLASGSLPPPLTLNSITGAITGTPTTAGTFPFTAKLVDSTGTAAGTTTHSCTIIIANPIGLTCPANSGTVGVPYSSALTASGGFPPYTFSITAGNLPTSLTLNPATGAITGTPTAGGPFTFTAKVVDSTGQTSGTTTTSCTITIIVPPPVALTCPATMGVVGVPFTSALIGTGGVPPYTFSIDSGRLPATLMLNAATGAITGTPTTAGTFTFTGKLVDSTGTVAGTTTQNCSITIANPIALTCPANSGTVGVPYSSSLGASGGFPPYTFSITSGNLPTSLTLNPATGAITGTTTAGGPFAFTAKVVDSTGTAAGTTTMNCTITVIVPPPVALTCPASMGVVGVPYSSALLATGGVPPYTFSIASGNLPPTLGLNPATGAITGTPATAGAFTFIAKAVDSTGTGAGTTTQSCTITVANAIALTCPANTGTVGIPYSSTLTATGGFPPYAFSISSGNLPTSLTLNPVTGAITGTPTAGGPFAFTARVADSTGVSSGVTTVNCTITVIVPPAMALTCPASQAIVGLPFTTALVATGGVPPYTFSITSGPLPPVLSLNTSTGAITGVPSGVGTFTFTAKVVDLTGTSAGTTSMNCTLAIAEAIGLSCPAVSGTVGSPFSSPVVATGGFPPYTYSIQSGSLPPPLMLNATTGLITGIPSTGGSFTFTPRVQDSSGNAIGATVTSCRITITEIMNQSATVCNGAAGNIAFPRGQMPEGAFLVRYATNLNVADSVVNITNTGLNGVPLQGPGYGNQGNLCVNVYGFSPDEQLVSCCSCLVTPNGLLSMSAKTDVFSNTLTGISPNSGMIKLAASLPGTSTLAGGLAAWGTTAHVPGVGTIPGSTAPFSIVETPFVPATLSAGELASITNRCAQIIGNGSGFGICRGCRADGRGAANQ